MTPSKPVGAEYVSAEQPKMIPNPLWCEKCQGRGYLVADAEWEPSAVQCDECKDRRAMLAASPPAPDAGVIAAQIIDGLFSSKKERSAKIEFVKTILEIASPTSAGSGEDVVERLKELRSLIAQKVYLNPSMCCETIDLALGLLKGAKGSGDAGLIEAAEAFRVAVIESGALNHVSQDKYFDKLRALETAIASAGRTSSDAGKMREVQSLAEEIVSIIGSLDIGCGEDFRLSDALAEMRGENHLRNSNDIIERLAKKIAEEALAIPASVPAPVVDRGAMNSLIKACEEEFTDEASERDIGGEADSDFVLSGTGMERLTFGHIRRARKALALLPSAVTADAEAVRDETAWLIEKHYGPELRYYAPTEPGEWTSDNMKACRFGRKQDAEAVQFRHVARGHLPEYDTRVCEHMWVGKWAA